MNPIEEPKCDLSTDEAPKTYHILLLTNRDSDNLGDQVIEACDIALIRTIMKNLGLTHESYVLESRAAAIVPADYVLKRDPKLLVPAREAIQRSDLIVFGGAPLFNYLYQNFYERTAVTLELAKEYHVPAIFSGIGVEGYDEDNPRCQRLKETLNFDIVKQITTRDGYHLLEQYKENPDLIIGKVSDPAVFTDEVFRPFKSERPTADSSGEPVPKKIGLFILRANGFIDNKIPFDKFAAAHMWVDLIAELQSRGYDYELLSSGHFGDEAFIDYLIRNYKIDSKKCIFNMNQPEKLIQKISSYDAVISTRLHPSIISFALKVPAIGIVWNQKVSRFYESIGYGNRFIDVRTIDVKDVADRIDQAVSEGVTKDPDYMMTVYTSLFEGIRKALFPENSEVKPYTYDQVIEYLPPYEGTTKGQYNEKLRRKFRRTYKTYGEQGDRLSDLRKQLKEEKEKNEKMKKAPIAFIKYYLTPCEENVSCNFSIEGGKETIHDSGSHEYGAPSLIYQANMSLLKNEFTREGYEFVGWKIRFRLGSTWFWLLKNNNVGTRGTTDDKEFSQMKLVIPDEGTLPEIPVPGIEAVVAESVWTKKKDSRSFLKKLFK